MSAGPFGDGKLTLLGGSGAVDSKAIIDLTRKLTSGLQEHPGIGVFVLDLFKYYMSPRSGSIEPRDKVVNYPIPEELFPHFTTVHPRLDFIMRHLTSARRSSRNIIKFHVYKPCGASLGLEFDPAVHECLWEIYEDMEDRTPTQHFFTINFIIREIDDPILKFYIRFTDGAEEGYVRQVINSMLHKGYLDDHGWLRRS